MEKLKTTFLMGMCFIILLLSGCGETTITNSDIETKNKIDTFDIDKQSIIRLFEETGRYIETNLYEFENNEKNTCGTIRLNPEDYDKIDEGDVLAIAGFADGVASAETLVLKDVTKGIEIPLVLTATERQRAILGAGGLLNYTRANG